VHAVADTVEGPYWYADVSVPGELENPMSVADGEGGVLIAYLDHTWPNGSAVNVRMPCALASASSRWAALPHTHTHTHHHHHHHHHTRVHTHAHTHAHHITAHGRRRLVPQEMCVVHPDGTGHAF